jgi:hypothetical protein
VPGGHGRAMSDRHISCGLTGRRRETGDAARIPPGQYLTRDLPVLSAGPTPHTPLDEWTFTIDGTVDAARTWTWKEFPPRPAGSPTGRGSGLAPRSQARAISDSDTGSALASW